MAGDIGKIKLKKPKVMDEFRDFISKGNVFALAVGIIGHLRILVSLNG